MQIYWLHAVLPPRAWTSDELKQLQSLVGRMGTHAVSDVGCWALPAPCITRLAIANHLPCIVPCCLDAIFGSACAPLAPDLFVELIIQDA